MLHPPVRSTFTTTDPDEGRARVAADYSDNKMVVRGDREAFRYEQTRADLGVLRLDTFGNSLTTEYAVEPLGQVFIAGMIAREMDIWTAAGHRRFGPGDVALIARPDEKYASRLHGGRMHLLGIDLGLLADVAGQDRAPRLRYEPLGRAEAASWRRTMRYVDSILLGDDEVAQSPIVLGHTARLLAATVLAAFAEPMDPSGPETPLPALLRRAIDYCETHPDLDLGVTDIAQACHASVRAVQLAFRRHLDTTPMAYLRKVRLDRVRAELKEADPASTTISRVAGRWGFADPSRFSALYRAAYDELPSATLRRR
ncbi:helix-turn-helix transcriptional regulator [Nocardioides stalactiti]|uniref:helix-turn-helix transcriptional regulator n=1 Tax=Nocardioides stalactiti TaxID=2755356 RepID=UPI001C7E5354|nr:helix-turn-helix transcriptional regulator [Nocardioides stalactiti]